LGGIVGLIVGGAAVDAGASYGRVMVWALIGPAVASFLVWWRYPETAHRDIDEISSSPTTR
ncbi:MAG: hypothetical protein RLY50_235, partial [Actinomycetota bacterium]